MLTLNETRTQLRVGRRRLMNLLDELQIEPIQIHARRQEISEEQFDQLQRHLQGDVGSASVQSSSTTSTSDSTSSSTTSTSDSTMIQPVIKLLEQQVEYLKEEINGHKQEKMELLQSSEKIQQLLSMSLAESSKLRQEIDRMRLLEDHSEVEAKRSKSSEDRANDVDSATDDVEDSVEVSTPTPAASTAQPMDYVPRSSSSWGLGIGLGAVAAAIIFYVLTSDQGAKFFPNIQQKLVGALHLSDTNSIVPYRFDADGGLR
ncbi:MAG TPA: hypothetical protein DGB85_12220 [Deltaproteobacteria bacterium]|nr:hypothetical protein [Deltaproteobacteria bacterium]